MPFFSEYIYIGYLMGDKINRDMDTFRVIVIGGGPAGLMAAGQAALGGARVTIFEKKDSPARKLRITGNGRCNLTNMAAVDEFTAHFGRNGKFLRVAFAVFFASDLICFFERLGIKFISDERGRVYPKSGRADDVADALIGWSSHCGSKIQTNSTVTKIIIENNKVRGVLLTGSKSAIPAEYVIITTGGASYPGTGSNGDGYKLAKALGHTIVPIRPASVPLIIGNNMARDLQGISLDSVAAKLMVDGKTIIKAKGDLIFTHFGLSGPVILSISRVCVDQLLVGLKPILSLDFAVEYDDEKLDFALLNKIEQHGKGQIQTVMKEFLPNRMAPIFLSALGIEPENPNSALSAAARRKIKLGLKGFELEVVGHRPLSEAMVTAGGVSLKEVNPQTMESRLIKGLFFAGEVLDLDADTGGFNLQSAFSTSWLAGRSVFKNSKSKT
jgi:hypothetical protein